MKRIHLYVPLPHLFHNNKAHPFNCIPSYILQAEFSLSKFCLKVNVMHTVLREQRLIKFGLDASRPNPVLRQAEGFWYVHAPNDRPNNSGWSRVYLSTNIVVSRMIPSIIVDYAAARALPRATTWLESFDFASITSK